MNFSRRANLVQAGLVGLCALGMLGVQSDSSPSDGHITLHRRSPVQVHRNEDGTKTHSPSVGRNQVIVGSETSNWSGYEVASYQTKVSKYTSASATWTVPRIEFGPTRTSFFSRTSIEYSSTWVGVGGFCESQNCSTVDQSLIQLGTEQDAASNGQTQFYAWVEMLPAFPIIIATNPSNENCDSLSCAQPVEPGDVITASLSCASPCTANTNQTWALSMKNNGGSGKHNAWTYTQNFTYDSALLSAVFIQEAPTGSSGVLPYAEPVSPVAFTATDANNQEITGMTLANNGIAMLNPAGQTSVPSPIAFIDEFNACWAYNDSNNLQACVAP